jgi:hypothetical protein
MLHRLLYISTATRPMSEADLKGLVAAAEKRNAALGVTGLLIFTGVHFMQLLEGEREAVENLFASICSDPRHAQIARLVAEPTSCRACPEWAMALRKPQTGQADPRSVFEADDDAIRRALPPGMPGDLRLLFQSFNSVMEQRAKPA